MHAIISGEWVTVVDEGQDESGEFQWTNPILDILFAEDRPPTWLIPDMLLQGALTLLVGGSATGKSYVSYTLGLALASGSGALSGIVPAGEPKRVLYFDQENGPQDRDKYLTRSWRGLVDTKGLPPDPDLLEQNFYPVHFALGGDDWFEVAETFVRHLQPHLIVFDTAGPCMAIQDENSNSEAMQAVLKVRRLMAMSHPDALNTNMGASALILKHERMSVDQKGPRLIRGAKCWKDQADGVIFQVKSRGRPRKDGLHLSRLMPDKTRAYGLPSTLFITPSYTDRQKSGLVLEASFEPSKEHRAKLAVEEDEDDE